MSNSIMIIGAGPGIGQSVAERFGAAGWRIVLTGRNGDRLERQAAGLRETGVDAVAIPADATDPTALAAAMAEADRRVGGLGVVHYNAAVVRQQDLFGMTDTEVTGDLAINVAGALHTVRAAADRFGERGGTILVTGGGLGIAPDAGWASLGLGKAALRNLVLGLAPSLEPRGIRVATVTVATLVAPGSREARDVAECFWTLATAPEAPWETVYPAA